MSRAPSTLNSRFVETMTKQFLVAVPWVHVGAGGRAGSLPAGGRGREAGWISRSITLGYTVYIVPPKSL